MTPTQIARRSDALYADGTCGMTRRVLCDMVAQREADIESLKAKNTKLQEQGERLFDKTLELGTENSKLRELVREIWKSCPVSEDDCAKCSNRIKESDEVWCDIPILMEQLGVLEVDE